jgi:hypothetical protein
MEGFLPVSDSVNVLIVGVPRSGTSWVGRVLGSTPGARYLREPDNHEHTPFALRAKLGVPGRYYTDLAEGDEAPAYARLWGEALGARPSDDSVVERVRRKLSLRLLRAATDEQVLRSLQKGRWATHGLRLAAALAVPERPSQSDKLVVKSVHAQLAVDWLAARFPLRVAVVLREPLNVLSSWKQMGWIRPGVETLDELDPVSVRRLEARYGSSPGIAGQVIAGQVEHAAYLIALLHSALADAARRHPEWVVLSHEALCTDPHERFRDAAADLGLDWGSSVDALLDELNRPGEGYETARVASDLQGVWRKRLSQEERDAAISVFRRFDALAPT